MSDGCAADVVLMLGGDVMLGRGIDQVLPFPGDPTLYEHWRKIRDARAFVSGAEQVNGKIPERRDLGYVWGDMLATIEAFAPDLRLINLETAITARGQPWPNKHIHYRMNPANIDVLAHAGIDFCSLANNHILDWGYDGIGDTRDALARMGIGHAGAGCNREQAGQPAILEIAGKGRLIVVSMATRISGVPRAWCAGDKRPGVNLIGLDDTGFEHVARQLTGIKQPGDLLVASIHWGRNYGYGIHPRVRAFARRLIDEAEVDLIHGHSSHHVRGMEAYKGKLILYGCGDLINDYEGIPKSAPQRAFAPELGLLYFARYSPASSVLTGLEMVPVHMHRLRIRRGDCNDIDRLCNIINQRSPAPGIRVVAGEENLSLIID